MAEGLPLPVALGLGARDELVALTGAGGKTSLMFALAQALPGRVVLTTTTRLAAEQLDRAPTVCFQEQWGPAAEGAIPPVEGDDLASLLASQRLCLVVSHLAGDKAVGVRPDVPARLLARANVDHVLVEADGARLLACKVPADYEPAVPTGTTVAVVMAGMDALESPIAEVAHRPERVAALTGRRLSDKLEAADLAHLLVHPQGGFKGLPAAARVVAFLNKAETTARMRGGQEAARLILREPRVERVILGALASERPVREVHQRITAVVLAAGESSRMGLTKQLLPWGDGTMLGQTLANLKRSSVHDICVVTGHEAVKVGRIAEQAGAWTVHNEGYERGMLTSLQAAVRRLPEDRAAVLVVLADQPMVEAETMERLLAAQRSELASLVAPVASGRRGNPVLIGRRHFDELLQLPAEAAPRELLARHADELVLVPVETDTVLRDLDRPEDYERWRPRAA